APFGRVADEFHDARARRVAERCERGRRHLTHRFESMRAVTLSLSHWRRRRLLRASCLQSCVKEFTKSCRVDVAETRDVEARLARAVLAELLQQFRPAVGEACLEVDRVFFRSR